MNTTIPPSLPLADAERSLFAFALNVAERLQQEHEDIPACMLAVLPDGDVAVISLSEMTKPEVNQLARNASAETPVALIMSAWRSRISHKPDSALAAAVRNGDPVVVMEPRLDPNRDEVAMVNLLHRDTRVIACAVVQKSASHANRTLAAWEFQNLVPGNFRAMNFGDGNERVL